MEPIGLGGLRIRKFAESADAVPAPAQIFAGLTPETLRYLRTTLDHRSLHPVEDTVYYSMHSFVLETPDQVILIDTCNGNGQSRSGILSGMHMLNTDYLGNLARLGLAPEMIDVVLCTHLHSDHVGWNTRLENGRWVP